MDLHILLFSFYIHFPKTVIIITSSLRVICTTVYIEHLECFGTAAIKNPYNVSFIESCRNFRSYSGIANICGYTEMMLSNLCTQKVHKILMK